MAKKTASPEAVSAPRGVGGSYTTDPVTGIRTRITPATSRIPPCLAAKITLGDPIEPAPEPAPEPNPEPAA